MVWSLETLMAANTGPFSAGISELIWDLKYRLRGADGSPIDDTLQDTFQRVAQAAAGAERGNPREKAVWEQRFYDCVADFGFLPAGRILAGAESGRAVTLFNCFVMGPVPDDLGGIFESVKDAALTLQSGGGIGVDFSTLRPKGAPVKSIGADASGPVSFMNVWDSMCRTIMSAGARRGAMMALLRADHPDIETFIDAKSQPGQLTNFNLSVLVSDSFMDAVVNDCDWDLKFDGVVYRTVRARDLWDRIMWATYSYAEPGVIFIDRINQQNNLAYCETISATNPCGEQPLPSFGACLLGSLNLTQFVADPFTKNARLDQESLAERVRVAVRLLDNLIDVSIYPLVAQRAEAEEKRRIGLGMTGLADALFMCGMSYGDEAAQRSAGAWMATIQHAAYQASAELAAEKGAFPLYDEAAFLDAPNVKALSDEVRRKIKENGIRNGCLTSIAPTGTISLLAGNISSGIEPVFDVVHKRRVLKADGRACQETITDYAAALYFEKNGPDAVLPDNFVTANALSPEQHLAMQASVQRHVDSSISKTINCPQGLTFDAFKEVYTKAYALGLKGCTTYRPNPVTGAVLSPAEGSEREGTDNVRIRVQDDQSGQERSRAPAITSVLEDKSTAGDIVYLAHPMERDAVLQGSTYKLKWPNSGQAIYVTINDTFHGGRRRPFEIFINSRNLEHYSWTVALTRMISAVFRRGGDVSFVAEELKAIFDPQGGYWMKGRYVPSLIAAIGDIIDQHLKALDVESDTQASPELLRVHARQGQADGESGGPSEAQGPLSDSEAMSDSGEEIPPTAQFHQSENYPAGDMRLSHRGAGPGQSVASSVAGKSCPRCSSPDYVREEGCWVCRQCLYSRCD